MPLSKEEDRVRKQLERAQKKAEALKNAKAAKKAPLELVPDRTEEVVQSPEAMQERYFELLAQNFEPVWAAWKAGVSDSVVHQWAAADPKSFDRRMTRAKAIFAGELQQKALDADHDRNSLLLMALLNAHNPKFGRPRFDLVKRTLLKFAKDVRKLLDAEFGKNSAAQIESVVKKMDDLATKAAQPFAKG